MPSGFVNRAIGRAAGKVPGLRALPVFRLLSAAEVAMLARDHVAKLSPQERRRLVELVREGRGRSDRLGEEQAAELAALVAKLEPRRLMGDAVSSLSPVPLPARMLYGKPQPPKA